MQTSIDITNRSMDLSACSHDWTYDEKRDCWCLEDIVYTEKAAVPKYQRLSIFVPKEYMLDGGVINPAGSKNGYTTRTVPVIFENNSAGYMQMPHTWLDGPRCYAAPYLKHGFVYVTCGNRGSESKDAEGRYCGKAPVNLVDLKTAIRFLRHNRAVLPGDFDRMISIGWSAGGAMSMLLAVTGDHPLYEELLRENGAFMEESDAVYASQCYCPIVDLEHADQAYEWMFHEDKQSEDSPAGPAEIMSPFKDALSEQLKKQYIAYFNNLQLKNEVTGEILVLNPDGRSGSGYDYLMEKLNRSASVFLQKLEEGGFERAGESYRYSVNEYLTGAYTYRGPAPKPKKKTEEPANLQGFAGPGVQLQEAESGAGESQEPPSLGELVSRPPRGTAYHGMEPLMADLPGDAKQDWLFWDGEKAVIKDLDTYILHHRRRMKGCTSFDLLTMKSGENRVFGSPDSHYKHYNSRIADALDAVRSAFPEEVERYYQAYADVKTDEEQQKQVYLTNPMNFIASAEGKKAQHVRIRLGAQDADTSFTISMAAALKLMEAGIPTDYAFVWDMPHSEADYDGEIMTWIDEIVR